MEKVIFTDPDTKEKIEFYVLEETQINGKKFLFVTLNINQKIIIIFRHKKLVYMNYIDQLEKIFLFCCHNSSHS